MIKKVSEHTSEVASGWLSWSVSVFIKKPVQWSFGNFVQRPLSWMYSKAFGGTEETDSYRPKSRDQVLRSLPDEQYVVVDLVKVSRMAGTH